MQPFVTFRYLALAILLLTAAGALPASFDDTAIAQFHYPEWFKTTFYDLRDDLADAREAGKRGIVLFFSTAGCSYCKQMLDGSFADGGFVARLSERYDVIGLEMFSDSEITDWHGETRTLSAFARIHGAQFSPTLVFLDTEGRRLLRLVGYYDTAFLDRALDYLDSDHAETLSLPDWRRLRLAAAASSAGVEPPAADPLFAKPPYQLDRSAYPARHLLLVLFEGSDCTPCNDFHRQVLGDPAIRAALRDFEVVRLDAADDSSRLVTPHGAVRTAAAWHRELGFSRVPAFAVFDEQGQAVVQTDALVLRGRFTHLLNYVRDRAYLDGSSFQRHARSENIRRLRERQAATAER